MSRLYAEPIPVRISWSEGEPESLRVGGLRIGVAEVVRRWRVDAEWWANGPARDYMTLRLVDGQLLDVFTDRVAGASFVQRVMD